MAYHPVRRSFRQTVLPPHWQNEWFLISQSFAACCRKSPIEGIACPGRIDDRHREASDLDDLTRFAIDHAIFADSHDDLAGFGNQDLIPIHPVKHQRRFMFIRREIRHFPDPVLRDIHVRCRIQHHRDACFKAAVDDIAYRIHRDLMLQHDEIRGRDTSQSLSIICRLTLSFAPLMTMILLSLPQAVMCAVPVVMPESVST